MFTPSHRGGSGPPLVCLHGFMDTWRTWEIVLPELERRHDVLALTLAGHTGGPPIEGEISVGVIVDAVERTMDEAGFEIAHIVGDSLGGYVALELASRGRAATVVALAPAGGWAKGDESYKELLRAQSTLHEQMEQLSNVVDGVHENFQAATFSSVVVSSSVTLMPSLNVAPSRSSLTSSAPLIIRQRSWAASSSL